MGSPVDVLTVLMTAESGYRRRAALEADPEHKAWLLERAEEASAARVAAAGWIKATTAMPDDATAAEVVRHFIRTCREMKPVGQWPGERVCAAIERLLKCEFIWPADRAPEMGHNGRGGDTRQPLPPYRGQKPAGEQT